jgi:2-hydroxychromene-2-carboxylate isomerase
MRKGYWYFDFISPFAYLQSEQLAKLTPHVHLEYRPVLFAGLLNHWGQKGPVEIETKRRFTFEFAVWQAAKLGIAFKIPPMHPFNPLALLRLAWVTGCDPNAIQSIFRFVWKDGRLPDTPLEWLELTSLLGVANAEAQITASRVKDDLRAATDEAIARGVFGVPTILIDDQLFWGNDATEMALDYLTGSPVFASDQFARVRDLPVGAARAR